MAGHIEKRGENSWRLVVRSGIGPDGKYVKKQKTIHAKNQRDAEKELAKFITEVESGNFIEPTKMTLNEFANFWMEKYAEPVLKATTVELYQGLLVRILSAMGHFKLDQIKPMHIIQFYNNLREDGIRQDGKPGQLSDRRILHHHTLLSSMLEKAVKWQLISSNPCKNVDRPKVEQKESDYYTEEEIKLILQKILVVDFKYYLIITLAIITGLRKGELLGLEWTHINFEEKTLKVEQASKYTVEKGIFTEQPKTKTSLRTLSIPDSVVTLLQKYKALQNEQRLLLGSKWVNSNRLFTQANGNPMHPGTPNSWFKKFLRKNQLPEKSFHALRHTSATLLIANNIDLKTVSNRLGHYRIEVTLNIYAHALKKNDQVAADTLSSILSV